MAALSATKCSMRRATPPAHATASPSRRITKYEIDIRQSAQEPAGYYVVGGVEILVHSPVAKDWQQTPAGTDQIPEYVST